MVMMKNRMIWAISLMSCLFVATACQNDDIEYPDFEYQTVYFAKQTPIRTITLGDDEYPRDLDNAHQCEIYAVVGGMNTNKRERKIEITVDNSLCEGLFFSDGRPVKAMPSEYYSLSSHTITIPKDEIMAPVTVQLTDAFFADPTTTEVTYVIPVRMVSATDSILRDRDYTLYAINYKNKYHGCWLSRGVDEIQVTDSATKTVNRMPQYWEKADLVYLTTDALQKSRYQVSTSLYSYETNGKLSVGLKACDLILHFDDNEHVTVTTDTPGCSVTGSGQWTRQGEKKAWGDKDRDQLKLEYEVTYNYESNGKPVTKSIKTTETLVMRDRQSKLETFMLQK